MKKLILLFSAVCLNFLPSLAQKLSFGSPYSAFGLGDIQSQTNGMQRAMGNLGIGFSDRLETSWTNPASSGWVRRTVFHMGMYGNWSQYANSNTAITQNQFNLAHLGITLPVAKKGTFSAVILPYTQNTYNIRNEIFDSAGNFSYRELYAGDGGINKVQAQYAHVFKNRLSLGVSGSYLFGPIFREQFVIFPDTAGAFNLRLSDQYRISDFSFSAGAQYRIFWGDSSWGKWSKEANSLHSTTIGLKYDQGQSLRTTREYLAVRYTTTALGGTNVKDTLQFRYTQKDSSGTIGTPTSLGIGLVFEDFRHWMVGADFVRYDWSNASFFGGNSGYQAQSYGVHVGGYYIPNAFKGESFWERSTYRGGFRMFQTGMQFRGVNINEWAITMGMTFANRQKNNPLSGVTWALEMGQRGTIQSNLIRDRFLQLSLSFNLTDRFPWFIPSKYD
jgi:hypothetical protein